MVHTGNTCTRYKEYTGIPLLRLYYSYEQLAAALRIYEPFDACEQQTSSVAAASSTRANAAAAFLRIEILGHGSSSSSTSTLGIETAAGN